MVLRRGGESLAENPFFSSVNAVVFDFFLNITNRREDENNRLYKHPHNEGLGPTCSPPHHEGTGGPPYVLREFNLGSDGLIL